MTFRCVRILFLTGNVRTGNLTHGHEVINPALPLENFTEAIRIAQAEFDQHRPQVVVGSSRGGAIAMNVNSGEAKLVLLCPAWKKYGSARTVKPETVILHSRADEVVPFADSEDLAKISGAYFVRQKAARSSPQSNDDATARKLWQASEELTGLSEVRSG